MKCAGNGTDPSCRDPSAPAELTATPTVEQVYLTWQAVAGATEYRVFQGFQAGVTDQDNDLARVSETTYAHTDLDSTRAYYYRVTALNPWGESLLSNEVSATPLPPLLPDAPSGVAATPGTTEVVVRWNPVARADGYRLYWHDTANPADTVIGDVQSPYSHAGLSNGRTYSYRVSAYNVSGEGPRSIEVSAEPQPEVVGAPENLTAAPGDGQVTLTWAPLADASSYTVYWRAESPATTAVAGITGLSYVHAGLENGTTYSYRISAMTGGGETPPSLEVSATPQPPIPATPGFLLAEPDSGEVVLSWGSVPGADSYELFWDTQPDITGASPSISSLATYQTHAGLSNGTTYYYRVRARNPGGAGNLSAKASATPKYQTSTQQKLTATDAESGDKFGYALAASGDTLLVGTPHAAPDGAETAGAAYVLVRTVSVWQQQTLTADDATAGDGFGGSVAISDDVVVVGAPWKGRTADYATGAAYLFERTDAGEWLQANKIVADDATPSAYFGWSVAVASDVVVVGAYADGSSGSAYVFERPTGEWQQTKLTTLDAQADAEFGWSVAVVGDTVAVGARSGNAGTVENAGAAFVFERVSTGTGWEKTQELVASDRVVFGRFGSSLAISDDTLVVGSSSAESDDGKGGAAYVFERTSHGVWLETTKIVGDDISAGDKFGGAVALRHNTLLVGAAAVGPFFRLHPGAAYVFERTASGWQQVRKLTATGGQFATGFGYSVAISNRHLVVGADSWDDDTDSYPGACFVY